MGNLQLPPFRMLHTAYVTRDVESGKRKLASLYGAEKFTEYQDIAVRTPDGGEARISFAVASVNGTDLEVIEPVGGQDGVYRQALPDDPADIAFHHFATAIQSEAEWNMALDAVERHGIDVPIKGGEEYGTHYIYLDTRLQLGHMLEFIWT